jgi:hypothetical protein
LTVPGQSFASRVCASLVGSAGMPELIVPSLKDYVAAAIRIGCNKDEAKALKDKLRANRDSSTLFDTAKLVASLEEAYDAMWEEFASGQLPQPDLTNLDSYEQAAIELKTMGEACDTDSYRKALAALDAVYPLAPDKRLWTGAAEIAEIAEPSPQQRKVA